MFTTMADPANTNVHSQLRPMVRYHDLNTFDTLGYTYNEALQQDGNTILDPKRSWKQYKSFRAIARSMKCPW